MPAILADSATPAIRNRVEGFFSSLASILESWVHRRQSPHTQRAYRSDVMAFVKFMGLTWPEQAAEFLRASVQDVQDFRTFLLSQNAAPKTLNRRVSSLSSFYKYLAAAAAELRLPITVPNPAHAQFISRESTDPREETRALSAARARQLVGLPAGNAVLDYRDRAILKFFLYSGARLSTACRVKVSDFHQDGDEATIRLHEKGDKRRTIGLHFQAAQAISEYIEKAEITSGPLFRPRLNSRSQKLGNSTMSPWTMWRVVEGYLVQLPGAVKEAQLPDGSTARQSVYTPHSLRATTATLLLDAGVDIIKVKELLGHRHVTTTQIYDKRRRSTSESASHLLAILISGLNAHESPRSKLRAMPSTLNLYRTPPKGCLSQGDLLNPTLLRDKLIGHQEYFSKPQFYRYMITTQTCDLARDLEGPKKRESSEFIFLAVVRKLDEALGWRHVENKTARSRTDSLLRSLLNHDYNKRGFFYLPKEPSQGIIEDCVVDLRVMFTLHRVLYDALLEARCGGISEVYAAQLGHMIGYMFSRVATPGWDDLHPEEDLDTRVERMREEIRNREQRRLEILREAFGNECAVSDCTLTAETFRWLPVKRTQYEGSVVHEAHILCREHATQHDSGTIISEGQSVRHPALNDLL